MIYVSVIVITILILLLGGCTFMQQERFGAEPTGERLEKVELSSNYVEGQFQNQIPTPVLKEGENTLSIIVSNMFSSAKNLQPDHPLPTEKVDLKSLPIEKDIIVWLGHSSFYIQLSGKRMLLDPILSDYASPVSFAIKAFSGTSLYSVDEVPHIDLLLISHDHWDHLDYDTVTKLQPKTDRVFVPLGIGAHFEKWGFSDKQINESDWYSEQFVDTNLTVYLAPSRHYSGRGLSKNKTLWGSFVLISQNKKLYFGGDSGYGPHFKELGQKFGPFDLVALDMGQYDPRWPYIHMTPQEASQAALDLNTKALLPAHVGRFTLAQHDWREPFNQIVAQTQGMPYQLYTPIIGQPLMLDDEVKPNSHWWE
ncbi:MBL fold metallo-hydrolase [Vibrio ziniensis]|uniref:RomA family MBL fold metallo-hydrolase n=1 Tax=Vibrio ziniensis TaxID=2711221 RepID=A0A6G7CPE8_9VIBR|nr:MBL fold metallo-hydrolase [Vibrio ziniensis]QIH44017.1 RomA family MBL fold metallo-hydrolase [Vibrio ziniensis]